MTRILPTAAVLSLIAACGGSSDNKPAPTIAVSSPAVGSTQALGTDSDKSVAVAFTTTNFTLSETCNGNSACGHIHVLIDGSTCNPTGSPYNNTATSSPAQAHFGVCPTPTGLHTVTLELHHQDHSAVAINGATVATSVAFTTQ
jgi:hypothetical protein